MVRYSDDFYNTHSDYFQKVALSNFISQNTDDEELATMLDNPKAYMGALDTLNPYEGVSSPNLGASSTDPAIRGAAELQRTASGLAEALSHSQAGWSDMDFNALTGYKKEKTEMTGSNIDQLNLEDPRKNEELRRRTAYEYAKLSSGDTAMLQSIERWASGLGGNTTTLSVGAANAYAKAQGADIKFSSPKTYKEVQQAVDTALRKKEIEESMALAYSTGDTGAWNNVQVMAAGLAGGIGPVELSATIGSAFIPVAGATGVAKGAGALQKALGLKKVADSAKLVSKANTLNKIAQGTKVGAEAESGFMASVWMRGALEKAAKAEEKNIKLARTLEELSGVKYDTLTQGTKMGGDMLSVLVSDIPFINLKKNNSDKLEIDTYSEQDKAVDTLLATGMGVFLPAGIRKVGSAFGIMPAEMFERSLVKKELEINTREAMGEITAEQASKERAIVEEMRKTQAGIESLSRKQNPVLTEMATQIAQENTSNETLMAQRIYLSENLRMGRRPRITEFPEFEKMFSSINAQVNRRLLNEGAGEVFGSALLRNITESGTFSVKVADEHGLLGRYSVHALDQREALDRLGEIYKASLFKDEEAGRSFKEWVNKYTEFSNKMSEIQETYAEQKLANRRSKAQGYIEYTADDLLPVRDFMQDAYIDYKLSPEKAGELKYRIEQNMIADANGALGEELPEEFKKIMSNFENLYNKYVEEDTNEAGKTLYNFKEKGKPFSKFVEDLDVGRKENAQLAEIDNLVVNARQEQVQEYLRNMYDLDVSADTDDLRLFGAPRQTFEDLQEINKKFNTSNRILSTQKIKHDAYVSNEDIAFAKKMADRYGTPDKAKGSFVDSVNIRNKWAKDTRESGFKQIEDTFINKMRDKKGFQKRLYEYLSGGELNRAIQLTFRDMLKETLSETELSKNIGNLNKIVKDTTDLFMQQVDKDPNILKAFADPETLKNLEGITEWTSETRKPEIAGKVSSSLTVILDPLEKALSKKFNDIELQSMNDLEIVYDILDLMFKNPEVAAEVPTGRATQTIYAWVGSKRSVESLSKTSEGYLNDLRNTLRKESAQDGSGQSLLDVMQQPSNRDAIIEAYVRMKHREEVTSNSDITRIAKAIRDNEASFKGSFERFGSSYDMPGSFIDRSKLRFMDVAMPDSEIEKFFGDTVQSLSMDPRSIVYSLEQGLDTIDGTEVKTFKRGSQMIDEKKALRLAEKAIKDMQSCISDLSEIGNPIYKKTAIWAFRDFDLDAMFDKMGTAKISLNDIRDAVLSGDWSEIIDGDLQKLVYASQDLRQAVTALIGNKPKLDSQGKLMISPTHWVMTFKNGFDDIAATSSGRRAAYLDEFESGIQFKNADSEIRASLIFGKDNVEQSVKGYGEQMCKAYYSLEQFGSDPLALVDNVIDIYNAARLSDPVLAERFAALAEQKGIKNHIEKYAITEGARESVHQNVLMNTGMQDRSPSWWARAVKATQTIIASPLLFKAGLKSFSDYATIWEGLLLNSYVDGRGEAMALTGKMTKFLLENPDLSKLVLACGIVEQEDIMKKLLGDPAADIMSMSKAATPLDKYEAFARYVADLALNKMAHIGDVTNHNKKVAALSIQSAIANHTHLSFNDLADNLKLALERESITGADWDFLRKTIVHDAFEDIEGKTGKYMDIFDPYKILKLSDKELMNELAKRGELNITPEVIKDFRKKLFSKAWNIVDSSADEMVSLPSNRIMNIMRGGRARNTGWGTLIEVLTQFQSFGAALLYNTYGKKLANFAARETGISIFDLFNPAVKLNHATRWQLYNSLFASFMTIGTTMLVVDSAVNATVGNIQKPIDEEGNIHLDNISSSMLGALGIGGTVLDAVGEGITGAGQRGGGFSIQVAPAVSSALRTGYRLGKPLFSSRVEDKPKAFSSAFAQEIARTTGLKTFPGIGLVWQDWVGSWLDMNASGGMSEWNRVIENRERRGQMIMPWENAPEPIWDRL